MKIKVIDQGKAEVIEIGSEQSLLSGLHEAGFAISAPCGGKGTCGKCKVSITGIGQVLSCQVKTNEELAAKAGLKPGQMLEIILPEPAHPQISTEGLLPQIDLAPRIFSGGCQLPLPSLEDQRADDERLQAVCGQNVPFYLLSQLPGELEATAYHPRFYFRADTHSVQRLIKKDQAGPVGVAIDIGTTTLGSWLYDLATGRRLAAASMLNPQRTFGADVISRIEQASASPERLQKLKQVICAAISELCAALLEKHNLQADQKDKLSFAELAHIVLTGNTTMMHMLAGLPPAAIARTPFIPVTRGTRLVQAAELGLPAPVYGDTLIQLMPSIASYVGADITAGILACGLNKPDPLGKARYRLLLDIGTNGEIVLDGPDGLVACSTAAGPAFEGANIACGMGGVRGAIDEVEFTDGEITYTIIGNGSTAAGEIKPRGLCGSGLVAAIASFLDAGLIDETGRICDEPETLSPELRSFLVEQDGQTVIELVPAAQSANGDSIYLNQKDIREVQNAKAAIAAGIELLIENAGLQPQDIGQVFIAGGFGNYLDVTHALRIGMLPQEFSGDTIAVGNTAGMGAVFCLLDSKQTAEAEAIINRVRYYELSADKRFTELYVDAMFFPEME